MEKSRMKHILFVGNNPGGLQAMLPVIQKVTAAPVAVTPIVQSLLNGRSSVIVLDPEMDQEHIHSFLEDIDPSLVVTGTSLTQTSGGQIENFFRQEAKQLHIPSLTILDHWCHYSKRFTGPNQIDRDSLPDLICVMDERAKKEMVAEGFPENLLKVTGQPSFDAVFENILPRYDNLRAQGRRDFAVGDERLISFISEPVREDHGAIRGYDEYRAFEDLLKVLAEQSIDCQLAIKLHPREKPGKFESLMTSFFKTSKTLVKVFEVSPTDNTAKFLCAADIVIGMTSTLLLQSMMIRKPTISYQPEAASDAPWHQLIQPLRVVTAHDGLSTFLQNSGTSFQKMNNFYSEKYATQKVLSTMQELMGAPL